MRKIGIIVVVLIAVLVALWGYLKFVRKTSPLPADRPATILTGTFADKPIYEVYGQVSKWFSPSDTLEIKLYLGKTVNLKVGDAAKSFILAPNPKDRINTTVLIKDMYTPQEWGRAFCEGDILLIGTKDNIWKGIKNFSQVEPSFVNVEDRPCYSKQL